MPNFGMSETMVLLVIGALGVIPWIAGIWALVTLHRIRKTVNNIERRLGA